MINGDTSLAAAWWLVRPMLAEQWHAAIADPGWVGFAVGGLLILSASVVLWLRFAHRRARAEVVAETGVVFTPGRVSGQVWQTRRVVEQPTQVIARTEDTPDATAVLPRVREVRRG